MINQTRLLLPALVLGAAALFTGCTDDEGTNPTSQAKTVYADTAVIGTGRAVSWIKYDDAGKPTSLGVTIDSAGLASLPAAPVTGTPYVLNLSADAIAITGYNHIGLDWNPMGHPPDSIYTVPHFDAHFYMISEAERAAINPADTAKAFATPGADYVPAGYTRIPGAPIEIVPQMGEHWLDLTSHELTDHNFDHTMIFGFWNGSLIFTEPMFTTAYLQTKPTLSLALPQPAKYPKTGRYYATLYSIRHDASTNTWSVSLDGLTMK